MPTILIVDDHPSNREFLATLLGYGGYRLLEAEDGVQGLAAARAERPDLVIADILMPTMDGYEFVRQLRADPAVAGTRVIFYTAHYHEPEARQLAAACGVSEVLTKPCEPEVVLRTVEAALGHFPPPPVAPAEVEFDREHLQLITDKLSEKASELRRTNARLTALVELGLKLGSERDPGRLLQACGDAAREIVGARYAFVGIPDGAQGYKHFSSSGMDVATAVRVGRPGTLGGVLGSVLAAGRCFRVGNHGGLQAAGVPPAFPQASALLAAPIVSPAHVHGWICLLDKVGGEGFTDEDERLVRMLTAQVGRVYENGRLYADLLSHSSKLAAEVAERRRAEEELRLRDRAIQAVTQGILITDPNQPGNPIIFASPGFERLTGYAAHECLGRNCRFLQGPKTDPQAVARLREAVQAASPCTVELLNYSKDGSTFWNEVSISPVRDDAGRLTHFVGVQTDVTARRALEEQFRHAQKMEAVGRLAGGVAHDFNNLLTVIGGYGEVALATLPADSPVREPLREMVDAGQRAAVLTRQLLTFSRKVLIDPKVLNPGALVDGVEKMLRRLVGEDIQLAVNLQPGVWQVKADPGQLEQVLVNLVVNSRDAMPQGGRLAIEVRNSAPNDPITGQHVVLSVSDIGCGMDEATLARIFEPFFSTKGERGTGLGLATVHTIVKECGGQVAVASEVGRGTTFNVFLPRAAESTAAPASSIARGGMPKGAETILLVEDEEGVRGLARYILTGCGYTLLEARDGMEAVRLAQQRPDRIDLMVTDVVMPRMSGREAAEQLAATRPGLKVLFLSGYTDDAIVRHGIREAEVAFLQKPFTPTALAQKVREVLDGDRIG